MSTPCILHFRENYHQPFPMSFCTFQLPAFSIPQPLEIGGELEGAYEKGAVGDRMNGFSSKIAAMTRNKSGNSRKKKKGLQADAEVSKASPLQQQAFVYYTMMRFCLHACR